MAETNPKKGINGKIAALVIALVTIGILVAGYMIWLKPPKPAINMPEAPPPVGGSRF